MKQIIVVVGSVLFSIALLFFYIFVPGTLSAVLPIHTNGILSPAAHSVFAHLGFDITTLEEANACAQKHLLRRGERWDEQEKKEVHEAMHANNRYLVSNLRTLGMINEVSPVETEYTYALVMGSLAHSVERRLQYLAQLCQQGRCFEYIVLLGGQRTLKDDERVGLPEDVATEIDMMKHLCKHYGWRDEKIIAVDAPMIIRTDGTQARPTTDTTVEYFAKIAPRKGSCLVVSNNPYILRQTLVAQRILDQDRFPTVGAGEGVMADQLKIVMLMDELCADDL